MADEVIMQKEDVISISRCSLDKSLAKDKLRIVRMTDVTVDEEQLVKALLKYAGVPGNECRNKAKKILKELVMGDQYVELEQAIEADAGKVK